MQHQHAIIHSVRRIHMKHLVLDDSGRSPTFARHSRVISETVLLVFSKEALWDGTHMPVKTVL